MVGVVRLRFLDGMAGLGEGGTEEREESEPESVSSLFGSRFTDVELNDCGFVPILTAGEVAALVDLRPSLLSLPLVTAVVAVLIGSVRAYLAVSRDIRDVFILCRWASPCRIVKVPGMKSSRELST
jgi:hypothetical protein